MEKTKKIIVISIMVLFSMSVLFAAGEQEDADDAMPRMVSIGTAGMGGTYYPMGIGISNIIEDHMDLPTTVELTGGTVENPKLIAEGEIEVAIANVHMAEFARTGVKLYENLTKNEVSGFAGGLLPGSLQYATKKDSGINSPADFKGKRIAVGPQGNSSNYVIQDVLEFYGVDFEEIKPFYVDFSNGMQALIDGDVDVAIAQAGVPTPAIVELAASTNNYKLLDFPDRDKLLEKYPYYVKSDIQAGSYDGQDEVVKTIGTENMIIVNSSLSEKFVYELAKSIFENLEQFQSAHPTLKKFNLDTAVTTAIPLHPGAEKYYIEQGVLD